MKLGRGSPDSAKVVSMCCGAPVYVAGDVTLHYRCENCHCDCNAILKAPEPDPEDEDEKVEE